MSSCSARRALNGTQQHWCQTGASLTAPVSGAITARLRLEGFSQAGADSAVVAQKQDTGFGEALPLIERSCTLFEPTGRRVPGQACEPPAATWKECGRHVAPEPPAPRRTRREWRRRIADSSQAWRNDAVCAKASLQEPNHAITGRRQRRVPLPYGAALGGLCSSKQPAGGLNGKTFPQLGCLVSTSVRRESSGRRQMLIQTRPGQ